MANPAKPTIEQPARAPLDARGERRPRFLLHFPHDPALEVVIRAFEAGDFLSVRRLAPTLVEQSENPAVRRAAAELVERTRPDPLLLLLLGASIALMAFLTVWAYWH